MAALGEVAPAGEHRPTAVDTRKIGEVAQFRNRVINSVANRYQSRRDQTDAAFRARKEILLHFRVGATGLLGHVDVAHRRHDETVFNRQGIHANGRKQAVVGVEVARHVGRAARAVEVIRGADPVAVVVDELLHECVFFQHGCSSLSSMKLYVGRPRYR